MCLCAPTELGRGLGQSCAHGLHCQFGRCVCSFQTSASRYAARVRERSIARFPLRLLGWGQAWAGRGPRSWTDLRPDLGYAWSKFADLGPILSRFGLGRTCSHLLCFGPDLGAGWVWRKAWAQFAGGCTIQFLHPKIFYTRRLRHQGRFAPKPTGFYTKKHLHNLLLADPSLGCKRAVLSNFCITRLVHQERFTPNSFSLRF